MEQPFRAGLVLVATALLGAYGRGQSHANQPHADQLHAAAWATPGGTPRGRNA